METISVVFGRLRAEGKDPIENIEEAIDWLRKKGISGAEKKSARVAADGVITVSVNNEAASLVEINSETDFVSRNSAIIVRNVF